MFQAPISLPPTQADKIDDIRAQIDRLRHRSEAVMETGVSGTRGQLLTVREAKERADKLGGAIEQEEAEGSQRHHGVAVSTKLLILFVVVLVDFPLALWIASSVFNVDWGSL